MCCIRNVRTVDYNAQDTFTLRIGYAINRLLITYFKKNIIV